LDDRIPRDLELVSQLMNFDPAVQAEVYPAITRCIVELEAYVNFFLSVELIFIDY
jgi:hypothetical protein